MRGSRWGTGVRTPPPHPTLKNHKFIGFPSNTGPEDQKATKPAFDVSHYRPASETPFQWRSAGRPIIAGFWWFLEPRSPQKTKKKKTLSELDPL